MCRSKNAGVAGYAEAFRPVQSDSQTSEWYSYFENDVLEKIKKIYKKEAYIMAKKGSLSITSENIFPVIKKWLYSDHDIFYRELISNGCDAITKLKKLELMGEYEKPEEVEYKIQVSVNPTDKTITIEDNGLGMTEEEIDKYINQIAFSGVQDFMEKYKDKANEDQIIGHFGLGFYSAFMVADKVEINSLSYQKDAKPVHWESEGGINFEMAEGDKKEVGTSIKLYLNEESTEFANEYRAREVIEKYCAFMPVNIFLKNETAEPEYETIEKDELTDKDTVVETVIEPAKTEEKEKEEQKKKEEQQKILDSLPVNHRYEVYYYLSTDKWQTAEDLDLSAITITAVTSYRSELNTDFLKDLTMTPENGAADVQECVAIEKVRLSVPTAFSSISYELTTQNKLYVKVGGINLAEAIYEEVYEENNVRYRLCYQMDTPDQLMFFTVENN